MAQDLFVDSTMTFGEHIEELRIHLFRALYGLLAATALMMGFGQYVVKMITEPVESELKIFLTNRMHFKINQMKTAFEAATHDRAQFVTLKAELMDNMPADEKPTPIEPLDPAAPAAPPRTIEMKVPLHALVDQLAIPMAEIQGKFSLKTLSAQEGFMIFFKAALGAAVVLASPWIFYQIYSFIAVGLYAHERRFVHLSLPFSISLFLLGVACCYFVTFPLMLKFFLEANRWMDLEPDIRLSEWVGFSVVLCLIFGVMFQLPILMLILERVGIISHQMLADKRKHAIFVMFLVAAVVTPQQDPGSQLALAIPLCLLYELGLFLMRYFEKKNPFAVPEHLEPEPA